MRNFARSSLGALMVHRSKAFRAGLHTTSLLVWGLLIGSCSGDGTGPTPASEPGRYVFWTRDSRIVPLSLKPSTSETNLGQISASVTEKPACGAPTGVTLDAPLAGSMGVEVFNLPVFGNALFSLTPTSGCQSVEITFTPVILRIAALGKGSGLVASGSRAIDCEIVDGVVGGTGCTSIRTLGTTFTLFATPAKGATFVGYKETCAGIGAGARCEVKAASDVTTLTLEFAQAPVATVAVSPAAASLPVGASIQLTASAVDASGNALTGRTITWATSDSTKIRISSSGLATAVSIGTAQIVAAVEGKSGSAALTVAPVPVGSITITPTTGSVIVGQSIQLAAIPRDSAGSVLIGRTVEWRSSDISRAAVSDSGVVVGLSPGSVDITASAEGKTAKANVTVTAVPVAAIALSGVPSPFFVGRSVQLIARLTDAAGNTLTGRKIDWVSSNSAIASVTDSGVVLARAPGTVTISATSEGKIGTAQMVITLSAVGTIAVTPDTALILAGTTQQYTAVVKDSIGRILTDRTVVWSVDPSKGTVSSSGVVSSAIANGTFAVTASIGAVSGTATAKAVTMINLRPGLHHTCGRNELGDIYCWGANEAGQLGDGTQQRRLTPVRIKSSSSFDELSSGGTQSCALTGGLAQCWGQTFLAGWSSISYGHPYEISLIPSTVSTSVRFSAIASGSTFNCGLSSSNFAYCWGSGDEGELGNGQFRTCPFSLYERYCSYVGSASPIAVAGGRTYTSISAGQNHVCALTATGIAYCWGDNRTGQIGDGTQVGRGIPTPVNGGLTFNLIRGGGSHTCALTAAGAAYCWGSNAYGQLGISSTSASLVPVAVNTALKFSTLALGTNHSCGLTTSGEIYCWGANGNGELGIGSISFGTSTPQLVSGSRRYVGLRAGGSHSCAVVDGTLAALCWGLNASGQLGDGSVVSAPAPVFIRGRTQ